MPGERKTGQDHPHYDWSPLIKRKTLRWPNNARVALVVILNLEYYDWEIPAGEPGAVTPFRPDLSAFSLREYGNRVGVFRVLKVLDKYGIKPTIAMDKAVADHYPYLVRECQRRNLEVMAHGLSSRRIIHHKMSEETERAYIRESIEAVAKATGKQPVGWLSPEFQESMRTPRLLAAEGIRYVCDWPNDEQPYRMNVPRGELFSLGIDLDLDDIYMHFDGLRLIDEYRRIITDTFDGLRRDGATTGRMMVMNLHPWVIGVPWRIKYLDRALAHITSASGVWNASGHEVIDWFKAQA